ncbi:MAG: acetyltransferase [Veillonellales bacterium]
MKNLLIIGAGGCGREVFQWAKDIQREKQIWNSIRFLDDDPQMLNSFELQEAMAGTIKGYQPCVGDEIICAIGDPVTRLALCNDFKRKGAIFANVIHPTVIIADDSRIGTGVIICPRTIISTNVQIGDFVLINTFCVAGHDVTIEQSCTLSAQCDLMGGAYLEEAVFLGSGARIFPGMRVGKQARIGAGSVVIRNVPSNVSVFGNPAKQIY